MNQHIAQKQPLQVARNLPSTNSLKIVMNVEAMQTLHWRGASSEDYSFESDIHNECLDILS